MKSTGPANWSLNATYDNLTVKVVIGAVNDSDIVGTKVLYYNGWNSSPDYMSLYGIT